MRLFGTLLLATVITCTAACDADTGTEVDSIDPVFALPDEDVEAGAAPEDEWMTCEQVKNSPKITGPGTGPWNSLIDCLNNGGRGEQPTDPATGKPTGPCVCYEQAPPPRPVPSSPVLIPWIGF